MSSIVDEEDLTYYKGYEVRDVESGHPDYSERAIAGARYTEEGEPYIAVFSRPEGATEKVLAHEWGHLKMGHRSPPPGSDPSHPDWTTWEDEIGAERMGTSTRHGTWGLSTTQLADVLVNMLKEWAEEHEGLPISKRNYKWLRKNLLTNSTDYGFTRNEMHRALKMIESQEGYYREHISGGESRRSRLVIV